MKKLQLFAFLFILVSFCPQAYAQKERDVWCFGNFAELDFSTGVPVNAGPSEINTTEGCASISNDTTGQLLFYTDGIKVWDRTNTVMPSDTAGLGGNFSTTQSAFILPMPGNDHEYYLFCNDAQAGYYSNVGSGEDSGTQYSIIDMNLNGGLGDVSQQPRRLLSPAGEKIAAAFNADSTGYWVIIHQWNSDAFYAYPVTADGIGDPVISHSGIVANADGDVDNSSGNGYMRMSADGSKLATAWHTALNTIQVFNFDRSAGTVSQPTFTDTGFGGLGPYGLCFSPSGRFLYYTVLNVNSVYQFDLQASVDTGVVRQLNEQPGAIQIGPDNKLYVAVLQESSIDQINFPDSAGVACGYQPYVVDMGNSACKLGLPEFPPLGKITKVVSGINELVKEENISVYPNPSTGSWQLSVSDKLVGSNLTVYDNEGRLIFRSTLEIPNSKLDLNVATGVYWLRISSPNANIVRKIVRL